MLERVVDPQRSLIHRHDDELLAELTGDVGLGDLRVGIGIGRHQLQAIGQTCRCLEFDTARSSLAGLHVEQRVGRIRRRQVLLHDIEQRRCQQKIGADGLILGAGLDLLAGGGSEG